jgi:hypothetical protein
MHPLGDQRFKRHGDSAPGYSPILNVVPADGVDKENGMIGYITIGGMSSLPPGFVLLC